MGNGSRSGKLRWKAALAGILLLAILAAVSVMPGVQLAGPEAERLANGDFEEGFRTTPAGEVGLGWHWFHNGGAAAYGFYQDTWAPVVYDGLHSQLVEINTYGLGGGDGDRYAGIYQTVAVVQGEKYELSVSGMLRALEDDPDRVGYSYRVQFGLDYKGGTDWRAVDNWVEIPWDTVHPLLSPGPMDFFSTSITARNTRLTLFVRVWKKWGSTDRELDVNLDGISLKGALPVDVGQPVGNPTVTGTPKLTVAVEAPAFPVVGVRQAVRVQGLNQVGVTRLELYANGVLVDSVSFKVGMLSVTKEFDWRPVTAGRHVLRAVAKDVVDAKARQEVEVWVGENATFLENGGFEQGFRATPAGMVGLGWGWFHSGGRANYSFYDDTWSPVVYKGNHSQLISVGTVGWSASDSDRYVGIYQTVDGLAAGARYVLRLHGMLRGLADDVDRSGANYRVEWGYSPGGDADWRTVDNWSVIPWSAVHPMLEPGDMAEFRTDFKAPASKVTLFFRVWKLWATVNSEVDVNLDAIRLTGYR